MMFQDLNDTCRVVSSFEQEPDRTGHLLFAQLPAGVTSDRILLAARWDFKENDHHGRAQILLYGNQLVLVESTIQSMELLLRQGEAGSGLVFQASRRS
jgi:hypothetical protein